MVRTRQPPSVLAYWRMRFTSHAGVTAARKTPGKWRTKYPSPWVKESHTTWVTAPRITDTRLQSSVAGPGSCTTEGATGSRAARVAGGFVTLTLVDAQSVVTRVNGTAAA